MRRLADGRSSVSRTGGETVIATAVFDIQRVQKARKAVVAVGGLAAVALTAVTASRWGDEDWHERVELAGLGLIAVCIVGRAWCSLYIGGRKKDEIVHTGPYSISRNPLYVFSFIGAFGMGAQSGSVTIAAVFTILAWAVFRTTVGREEAWLSRAFGRPYRDYLARTPRFWPNFRLWRDAETLEVRPVFFRRTIVDGLVFLLAYPLFELFEKGQQMGWLPVLLRLP